jgi:hypothetical protein
MVYISPTKQRKHSWVSLPRCRWKGPPIKNESQGLKTFDCLKDIYPGNKRLFCEILGIQDSTLTDLIHEARYCATGDSVAHITFIFHTMEKFLVEENPTGYKSDLRTLITCNSFPISKNWKLDTNEVLCFQNASSSSEWFIADTNPMRTTFAGIIPLLDIKVDDLAPMDQVLQELGLKSRFLSKQARSMPRTQGVVELNQELTDTFRSKVDFIIGYVSLNSLSPHDYFHFIHRPLIPTIQQYHRIYNGNSPVLIASLIG